MFALFRSRSKSRKLQIKQSKASLSYEPLEARNLLATFSVLNLNDAGDGSLRQAMLDANNTPGADIISFDVAGTIQLAQKLPELTDEVDIDGRTAPGFTATPTVEIDFNGARGMQFESGASGSALRSLSIVDASKAGVKLNGVDGMLIAGNIIGLRTDGTAAGNHGNGLELSQSSNNTIGGDTAVERNVISGNSADGLRLQSNSNLNTIAGNYIGTNVAGTAAIGNGKDGVVVRKSHGNLIGHLDPSSGFQLSNVVSGNGGNGVTLHTANDNVIAMNYIGTDVTGTVDLGNAQNGIHVTRRSADNLIGGEATGGNDPTNSVFVRPPQGNLISGNDANGVLINRRATANQLSGNFIGTVAAGSAALGNSLDGVAIEKADGNSLIGCLFQDEPFVFYNVISGNGGNGLRVNKADDTTIQANFFGMGADNDSAVGNMLNGVVVEGNSKHTVMGGPIPLGNVVAANVQNGIVVQDKASYFTTYNTFCGLAAFSDDPTFGNGQDGMLITSKGGNILIRTNVITRNGDDGIEISGKAKGVRVAGNIIGLNTDGLIPMGNADNGVEIGGKARKNLIGGPQPTFNVIPQNTIGSNGNNGVAIVDAARDNIVSNSYIGTDVTGQQARGNANAGVFIGSGTRSNTIGSPDPTLPTVVSANDVSGIEMSGTRDNTVMATYIGVAADGTTARGNGVNGILLTNGSYDNVIGSDDGAPANIIANNIANGIFADSGTDNAFVQNSIYANALLGIGLGAGANNNQAAPVLTGMQVVSGGLQITGTLTSQPKTKFTLEFFASDANEPSGQYFLGSLQLKTSATGDAAFTFLGTLPPMGADYITATATDSDNNTSEFSAVLT